MEIIISESVMELVPAGARLALTMNQRDSCWLVNQFIEHRSTSNEKFSNYIIQKQSEFKQQIMFYEIVKACDKVEYALDHAFPFNDHQSHKVKVVSVVPFTRDPAHGTRINIEPTSR